MVASRSSRMMLPIAPAGALALMACAVAAAAALPVEWIEAGVASIGLPRLMPAAAPPLGASARLLLALAAGVGVGAAGWAALFLLVGRRRIALATPRSREAADGVPTLRRADAHPDAPARRPIFAGQDLGEPFLAIRAAALETPAPPHADDVPVGRPIDGGCPLPADLDQPLASFDPAAVPDEPLEPVRAVPSLTRPAPLVPGERIATFALQPGADAEPPSLEALLSRLEDSARRGAPRPAPLPNPAGSLEDTLASLRGLARTASAA